MSDTFEEILNKNIDRYGYAESTYQMAAEEYASKVIADKLGIQNKWVAVESIINLKPGSLVRHKMTKGSYRVTVNYGERATAVNTVDITNPDEWEIFV